MALEAARHRRVVHRVDFRTVAIHRDRRGSRQSVPAHVHRSRTWVTTPSARNVPARPCGIARRAPCRANAPASRTARRPDRQGIRRASKPNGYSLWEPTSTTSEPLVAYSSISGPLRGMSIGVGAACRAPAEARRVETHAAQRLERLGHVAQRAPASPTSAAPHRRLRAASCAAWPMASTMSSCGSPAAAPVNDFELLARRRSAEPSSSSPTSAGAPCPRSTPRSAAAPARTCRQSAAARPRSKPSDLNTSATPFSVPLKYARQRRGPDASPSGPATVAGRQALRPQHRSHPRRGRGPWPRCSPRSSLSASRRGPLRS